MALIDQAIVSGTNFLTSMMIGRFLGKESLGLVFITFSIFTLLQCIVDQLVHVPFLVRAPRLRPTRVRRAIGSSFVHALALTTVACLTLCLTSVALSLTSPTSTLSSMLMTLACLLPGMMLREFMHSLRHNQLRQGDAVLLDLSVAVVQITLLFGLITTGNLNVQRSLLVVGGAATVVALGWLPSLLHQMRVSPIVVAIDLQRNWQIGRWTLGSYLIGSSAPTLLPWFLVAVHGTEVTGLLAACLALFGIAQTFLRGVGKYMGPQLAVSHARGGRKQLIVSLKRFAITTLTAMTAIALMLAIAGPFLIRFAYGSQYDGTGRIMQVLAIACWLQTVDVLAGNCLLAVALSQRNFRADCWRCVMTLAMALLLVPAGGPLGVVVAMTLGMTAGLIMRARYLFDALTDDALESGVGAKASCVAS